ncbi:MAG: methionine--tRNA ligase [archaeon]
MAGKFYITTAIPYVNAAPHIGHALEFIQTDVIARFQRLLGREVFFLTGTDENAQKNVLSAEAAGIPTQELVDRNTGEFVRLTKLLSISNDDFIRTTDKVRHWTGVEALWKACFARGDIYKKSYSGLYCVGCEAFVTEKDLVDGKCPEHLKEPEGIVEENYFFRLSKYQKKLEELIESDKLKIVPETRKNEVLSFIRAGLEDFSVSRPVARMKGWGIPVPGDASQMIYVWYDALGNYITGIGYGQDETEFKKNWPADLHVIGKGIIRFHAVYWPAMLLSAGVEPPKEIFVHGYITVEGQKMSKSIGNIVSPEDAVGKFGVDSVRYFLLREISPFEDGDYSERVLIERVNNELVANFGNLAYRTMTFAEKNFSGVLKKPEGLGGDEENLLGKRASTARKVEALFRELKLREALEEVLSLSSAANKYFQEKRPWELVKTDKAECEKVLFISAEICKSCAVLLLPFVPDSAERCLKMLGIGEEIGIDLALSDESEFKLGKPEILFRKIEVIGKKEAEETGKMEGKISIEDFRKAELKVATILSAEQVPGANKLLKLALDIGEAAPRTIVSGIYPVYTPEELVGKQIIVIANLEPAKIRGVESNGMLLAAWDEKEGQLSLIHPGKQIKPGTLIC